jgi:hypothetical protein
LIQKRIEAPQKNNHRKYEEELQGRHHKFSLTHSLKNRNNFKVALSPSVLPGGLKFVPALLIGIGYLSFLMITGRINIKYLKFCQPTY